MMLLQHETDTLRVSQKPIELPTGTNMETNMPPNPADKETAITFTTGNEPFSFIYTDIAGRVMYVITGQHDKAGNLQEIR